MDSMHCADVGKLLPAWQDGDLPAPQATAVAAHLAACTACSRAADELTAAWDLLDAAAPPPLPSDFASRVMVRVVTADPMITKVPDACADVVAALPALEDGEVAPPVAVRLHQHLAACSGCASEQRALEQSWAALEAWPEIEPQPYFVSRVWRRIANRPSINERISAWVQNFWRVPARAGALAAVMGVFLLLSPHTPPPEVGVPPAVEVAAPAAPVLGSGVDVMGDMALPDSVDEDSLPVPNMDLDTDDTDAPAEDPNNS